VAQFILGRPLSTAHVFHLGIFSFICGVSLAGLNLFFYFSHVGGLQQKPLGPSAQPSPALVSGEKNNSKLWITTYQSF
jgi:hypothetical protein